MIISQLKSLAGCFVQPVWTLSSVQSVSSSPADSSQTPSAKKRKRIRKKFSAKKRMRLFHQAERMKNGGEPGATAAGKTQLKDRKKK